MRASVKTVFIKALRDDKFSYLLEKMQIIIQKDCGSSVCVWGGGARCPHPPRSRKTIRSTLARLVEIVWDKIIEVLVRMQCIHSYVENARFGDFVAHFFTNLSFFVADGSLRFF